jgi:hypothetical protein
MNSIFWFFSRAAKSLQSLNSASFLDSRNKWITTQRTCVLSSRREIMKSWPEVLGMGERKETNKQTRVISHRQLETEVCVEPTGQTGLTVGGKVVKQPLKHNHGGPTSVLQ